MFSYSPLISPSATAEISAEAYVLIEASSKTILDSGAPHKKMEPASTTKILTALVAIENGDLSSVFKVSKNAAEVEGSQLGIEAGDEVEVDFDSGMIYNKTKGTQFKGQAFPEFMQKIIKAEGLVNYINAQH